jgi:lysophospholipase L1-like esterase
LGDWWTFCANGGQDQAYPQQLSSLLKQEFPKVEFEVLNVRVLGYSSYRSLEQLKRSIGELVPDRVIIGYAMNDASVAGYRDRDMHAYNSANSFE